MKTLPHSAFMPLLLACLMPSLLVGSLAFADDAVVEVSEAEAVGASAEGAEAEAVADTATESDTSKSGRDWVSGRLQTGLDAAWDGSGSDLELYQILRLGIEPPSAPRLKLQSSLWFTEDLDGDEARYSSLYGIDDGYGGAVRARVLELYLQAEEVLGGGELRIGRQRLLDGPLYNRIDGLRIRWDKPRWDAYFYLGSRASLYEDPFDDLVLGAGAGYRITNNTRIGVDLYHARDDRAQSEKVTVGWLNGLFGRNYPRRVDTRVEDQLLGLNLYHRFNENHWLNAQLLLQDDGAHEYSMDLTGLIARWDLTYLVNYRRQFDRVNDRVNDLTGYYRILGGLDQYHHVHLGLYRPITQKLTLGFESDIHDTSGDDYPGSNRDYVRLAATLSAKDVGKGVGFNVSLNHWDTSGEEGSWLLTGEIHRKWKAFELGLGADYEQYRYEYVDYNPWPNWIKTAIVLAVPGVYPGFSPIVKLTDTREVVAREEIHSLYTRFAWRVNERQRFTARLAYEDDDGPYTPYWRFRAGYEIEF